MGSVNLDGIKIGFSGPNCGRGKIRDEVLYIFSGHFLMGTGYLRNF